MGERDSGGGDRPVGLGRPVPVRPTREQDDARHSPPRQHQGLRVPAGHHVPVLRGQVREHHGEGRHLSMLLQVNSRVECLFHFQHMKLILIITIKGPISYHII